VAVREPSRLSPARPAGEEAPRRLGRGWPGVVWAVPLAALIVAGYLGLNAYAQQGIDVVVTFPDGAGVKPGSTRVVYQGVEAGRVTGLQLNRDGHRVDVTIRLVPRARRALVEGTTFYYVGAGDSITDVAALHAALAGVAIGVSPVFGGKPTRTFVGLEHAPVVPPGSRGVPIVLTLANPGALQPGNGVTYHGIPVGKITWVHLTGLQSAEIGAFIRAPFERLVRTNSIFWTIGAVQVSLSSAGLDAHVNPAAILHGEIAFDTPETASAEPFAAPGSRFPLYADQERAQSAPSGPQVLYRTRFSVPVGALTSGAPVLWHGVPIGTVRGVSYGFDAAAGAMSSTVAFAVSPRLLHLDGAAAQSDGYWRRRIDAGMASLAAHGWRFRVGQSPPLVGEHVLDLERTGRPATLRVDDAVPLFPSNEADDDLIGKTSRLLDHLDRIPFAEIGTNVERATDGLARLTTSPDLHEAIRQLDSTMTQLDGIATSAKPEIGPLLGKLNAAADQMERLARHADGVIGGQGDVDGSVPDTLREVSDAARSLRALSDTLSRHPESIIRGRRKEP
jgi:paraquat-inducible protein B